MLKFVLFRLLKIFLMFFALSVLVFFLIQLPPGDFLSMRIEEMALNGNPLTEAEIVNIAKMYHLNEPMPMQYIWWIGNIVTRGDFGRSFSYDMPVTQVIGSRLLYTVVFSLCTLFFTMIFSFVVGIISAVKQYSWFDYLFSFIGFIGVSIPGFLLAMVAMYTIFKYTGVTLTGLFSPEYANAPWSWLKLKDMLGHIWFPLLILGLSGTASMIRSVRAQMLDELNKGYVVAARARGLKQSSVIVNYPMRVVINPTVSQLGPLLQGIVSGESIVATVLNLQTLGPILLRALLNQDMYLAGSILLLTSIFAMTGSLISDLLLMLLDPRIRPERKNRRLKRSARDENIQTV